MRATIVGLAFFAIALFLLFPLGCFESDGGPSTRGHQHGECPENLSRIGIAWPSGGTGLLAALAISSLLGLAAAGLTRRRVPPRA